MNIRISIRAKKAVEKANEILEEGMKCISQAAKEKPQWKKHKIYDSYETECDVSEDDIIPVFEELIAKYPELDIYAIYSYEIREDDSSAQWWKTTNIKTKHHSDGTATLDIETGTYWF